MKRMRNCIPYLLMAWPYIFFLIFLLPDDSDSTMKNTFLCVYIILTIIVYVLNIWNAFSLGKRHDECRLALYDMLIKLIHIPFYLIVFAFGFLMFVAMVVPALVFLSPFVIMILFFVDLFLMLTSSTYGISAAIKATKKDALSMGTAILYGVFHCLFVTDVISAILLYLQTKKMQRLQTHQRNSI